MSGLNSNEEEFSFIKEKIKEKPLSKKRLAVYSFFCVAMALIFGLLASFTFALTKPYFEAKLTKEEKPDQVSIPRDETAEETESAMAQNPSQPQQPNVVDNPDVSANYELELKDIETLYKKLNEVAKEADKFIVTVTGVTSDVDWFNDTLENKGQAAGIIVANNGQELIMLTNLSVVDNVEQIRVTFCNGCTVEGSLGKYDSNANLAIVSVPLSSIDESIMDNVGIATLGNSYASYNGDMVIALGSPLGYSNSVTYGMLTSTSKTVTTIDANYHILTTDAAGSQNASGVLINLEGQVIGMISPQYTPDSSMGVITALAISDLKSGIQKLSNQKDVVYFGVKGSEVTADIVEQQKLPVGVYIVETVMDSPAMNAGLQNGDVITKLGTEEIKTVRDLQNELNKYSPNEVISVVVKRQGIDEYKDINFAVTLGAMN